MLLSYTYNVEINKEKSFLAIIPDLVQDKFAKPIPIDKLLITDCAVFYISNVEAINVKREGNGILITPLGGILYLTTNLPDKPGVMTKELKITKLENKQFQCHYKRDKDINWTEWAPYKTNI